jgi:CHAP domain
MDPIGQQLLKVAKSQLGYTEKASGYTKYGDWYGQHVDKDSAFKTAPWCDMFLAWAADKAGVQDSAGEFASTPQHARWFKKHGAWGHKPEAGAFAFYSFSGGKSIDDIEHVGIVEKVDGHTLHTIEANHFDHLGRATRDTSQVVGYGYPSKVKVAGKYVPRHSAPAPTAQQIAEQNRPSPEAQTAASHETAPPLPDQQAALTGMLAVVLFSTVALAIGRSKVRVPAPNVRVRKRGKHHRTPVALPADVSVADLDAAEAGTEVMPALSVKAAADAEDKEFWGKIAELKDDEELDFWNTLHSAASQTLSEVLES